MGYSDVQVNLKDINDNAPIFPQGIYIGNVTENGTSGKGGRHGLFLVGFMLMLLCGVGALGKVHVVCSFFLCRNGCDDNDGCGL